MEAIRYKVIPRNIKIKISKLIFKKLKKEYNDQQPYRDWKNRIEKLILELQEKNKINKLILFSESSFRSIFDTIFKDLNLMVREGEKNKYTYFLNI